MIGQETLLKNFVGGHWENASSDRRFRFGTRRRARCSPRRRCRAAPTWPRPSTPRRRRLQAWRRTPAGDRIQPLFRLKALLDAQFTEIARLVTRNAARRSPSRKAS